VKSILIPGISVTTELNFWISSSFRKLVWKNDIYFVSEKTNKHIYILVSEVVSEKSEI
jgi:hypothetical protein